MRFYNQQGHLFTVGVYPCARFTYRVVSECRLQENIDIRGGEDVYVEALRLFNRCSRHIMSIERRLRYTPPSSLSWAFWGVVVPMSYRVSEPRTQVVEPNPGPPHPMEQIWVDIIGGCVVARSTAAWRAFKVRPHQQAPKARITRVLERWVTTGRIVTRGEILALLISSGIEQNPGPPKKVPAGPLTFSRPQTSAQVPVEHTSKRTHPTRAKIVGPVSKASMEVIRKGRTDEANKSALAAIIPGATPAVLEAAHGAGITAADVLALKATGAVPPAVKAAEAVVVAVESIKVLVGAEAPSAPPVEPAPEKEAPVVPSQVTDATPSAPPLSVAPTMPVDAPTSTAPQHLETDAAVGSSHHLAPLPLAEGWEGDFPDQIAPPPLPEPPRAPRPPKVPRGPTKWLGGNDGIGPVKSLAARKKQQVPPQEDRAKDQERGGMTITNEQARKIFPGKRIKLVDAEPLAGGVEGDDRVTSVQGIKPDTMRLKIKQIAVATPVRGHCSVWFLLACVIRPLLFAIDLSFALPLFCLRLFSRDCPGLRNLRSKTMVSLWSVVTKVRESTRYRPVDFWYAFVAYKIIAVNWSWATSAVRWWFGTDSFISVHKQIVLIRYFSLYFGSVYVLLSLLAVFFAVAFYIAMTYAVCIKLVKSFVLEDHITSGDVVFILTPILKYISDCTLHDIGVPRSAIKVYTYAPALLSSVLFEVGYDRAEFDARGSKVLLRCFSNLNCPAAMAPEVLASTAELAALVLSDRDSFRCRALNAGVPLGF